MAKRKAMQQDLFMQWRTFKLSTDATDSSDVATDQMATGLSIRGDYAWIIHRVEMAWNSWRLSAADNFFACGLTTESGRTSTPDVADKGCIATLSFTWKVGAAAEAIMQEPLVWGCLPPMIIASPNIHLYCQTGADEAALRSKSATIRIGYTTVPIDQKTYLEIAETFETL
jgi:hypothetical protein